MSEQGGSPVRDDHGEISQLILRWGYCRDHGLWDELADTFHPDGDIRVTWYVGPFSGFVEGSIAMARGGSRSAHVLYPSLVEVRGERAMALTPVEIRGRAKIVLGVEVDMTSEAQFVDLVERREGRWRILRRVCVYRKDRMDSVTPSLRFWLLRLLMPTGGFDPAYRHLGVVLKRAGYEVQPGQVVDGTDAASALYAQGQRWLQGEELAPAAL